MSDGTITFDRASTKVERHINTITSRFIATWKILNFIQPVSNIFQTGYDYVSTSLNTASSCTLRSRKTLNDLQFGFLLRYRRILHFTIVFQQNGEKAPLPPNGWLVGVGGLIIIWMGNTFTPLDFTVGGGVHTSEYKIKRNIPRQSTTMDV